MSRAYYAYKPVSSPAGFKFQVLGRAEQYVSALLVFSKRAYWT